MSAGHAILSGIFIHTKNKIWWKKRTAKALKPSEMGLHSRVRFVIHPQGNNRTEQMKDIIGRAVYLFYAVRPQFCPDKQSITRRFAKWASRSITFIGFTDDEVFQLLNRESIRQARILRW